MPALLTVEKVHKKYTVGKTVLHILKGVDLEVAEGERVAIIGLSGSGKSTLLHILGGLDVPDEGSVSVRGQDLRKMTETRRTELRSSTIGFVFQSYHLLPEMDVLENVVLPALALPRRAGAMEAIQGRAKELLASVGLLDRTDHLPLELSGGEQQRVALARALINDPQLILADEPTGNLDVATGGQVLDNLFALVKNHNRALVLVTHNDAVASACDRVFRLKDGVLVPV